MANNTSLREIITSAKTAEDTAKYEENVAPMKADITEFINKLRNYCINNKTLEVRIIYKTKEESLFGFFGRPVHGNQVIISGWSHTEIEEAWIKLLMKWYFTRSGGYLIPAVRNIAAENEFSTSFSDDGWGWGNNMILFSVK